MSNLASPTETDKDENIDKSTDVSNKENDEPLVESNLGVIYLVMFATVTMGILMFLFR
ncbi:hypothetical protein [Clostridium sp. DJ247]|uniref:hypothetical protein n=1 Tax=Clostridium sp. DJ247 TaxID=2726188 RepID=UPI00162A3FC4|nr:hypothetical protein [Clostridium sp. DJ247]MBC2578924.1 hypothetical protein [Clostridium sp. DJ247]